LAFFAAAPPAALVVVEPLLPMMAALNENFAGREGRRDALQEKYTRKKMMAVEWGKQLLLQCHFSHPGKSLVHPNCTLRKGNGWVNLAVHMSAPCALWPPICTVIEETWWIFFTHAQDVRSNAVNSRGTRLLGPWDVQSCQCQVILVDDGVTARRNQASSLTSFSVKLFPFVPREKLDFGSSCFRGMYY
jgi:hypothetical protein